MSPINILAALILAGIALVVLGAILSGIVGMFSGDDISGLPRELRAAHDQRNRELLARQKQIGLECDAYLRECAQREQREKEARER